VHKLTLVEGNHEEKHRRFRNHLKTGSKNADQMTGAEKMHEFTKKLSNNDIAFLDNAVLFLRIPEHNILVVHAGIPGNMLTFPVSNDVVQSMSNKERKYLHQVLRVRYIDKATGRFQRLGAEQPDDPFWAEIYDGRFGHVVFGHQPFMDGARIYKYATGIDTGAVFGGLLTALVLNNRTMERCLVSVASSKQFRRHLTIAAKLS
ncbi:MAG: hypothetical protein QF718_09185, partial [Phycisphaerales bacterium]|nr:hypothetical protein [Phycisphaerales bacterium]